MRPSPIPRHQTVILALSVQMTLFVKQEHAGQGFVAPLDVSRDKDNIFQPDLFLISKEKAALVGEKMIEGAPDLVAEVLSPSSACHDLRTKFRAYGRAGVQECWIVDPERNSVERFQLLPGFSVDLADIFP